MAQETELVKQVLIRYYNDMNATRLHEYLERLSNLLRNESRKAGADYGLLPIQLEALHYLSICNHYSNTPMGVTDYLGQTKGSVSQSLKVLEKKGFLTKHADINDKRINHLLLTKSAKVLLDHINPSTLLVGACEQLSPSVQKQLTDNLEQLLRTIQRTHELKTFGVCQTCRYHQALEHEDSFVCGLTKETLKVDVADLICREHES